MAQIKDNYRILSMALRYALNRDTLASAIVSDEILRVWNDLQIWHKKQFCDEIIDAKQDKNPDYNEILRRYANDQLDAYYDEMNEWVTCCDPADDRIFCDYDTKYIDSREDYE